MEKSNFSNNINIKYNIEEKTTVKRKRFYKQINIPNDKLDIYEDCIVLAGKEFKNYNRITVFHQI